MEVMLGVSVMADAHMVGPGCFQSSGAMPSSAPMPDMNLPNAGGNSPRSLGSRTVSPGRRPMPAGMRTAFLTTARGTRHVVALQQGSLHGHSRDANICPRGPPHRSGLTSWRTPSRSHATNQSISQVMMLRYRGA